MFKKLILASMIFLFSTFAFADKETNDITDRFKMPPPMKDCSIYRLDTGGFNNYVLYVTSCPHRKTSTTAAGKYPIHVLSDSILDGETDNSGLAESQKVITVNGEKYVWYDSMNELDFSKTVDINGQKYVKMK